MTATAMFHAPPAGATPIFRLAGGGSAPSPPALAPLGGVFGDAVAPMARGRLALVGCRTVIRIGRNAETHLTRMRWTGRPPPCEGFGPHAATPIGRGGDLLAAGLWRGRVVRITPAGRATVVAGPRAEGDQRFYRLGGLAVLPDGGFLVSDTENRRVRRVSADGTITTVAGTSRAGSGGDGGPAVEASLTRPMGLAVEADGGFLIADVTARRVRRVRPDGTIVTVAGNGVRGPSVDGDRATETSLVAPRAVAALPAGAFLIADPGRIRRVGPAGHIRKFAGDGRYEWNRRADAGGEPWPEGNFYDGVGGPATGASIGPITSLAVASDESYIVGSGFDESKVYVIPARKSAYFGVAFRKLRPRLGYVAYRATRAADVTLRFQPRRGEAFSVEQRAHAGLNRVRIPAGTGSGLYHLRLLAAAAKGYRSADEVLVIVGSRLRARFASATIDAYLDRGDYENTSEAGFCHRMSRARVDCAVVDIDTFDCESKWAVRLHAGGQLESVAYPCGPWRREVRWRQAGPLPLFGAM